MRIAVIGLGSIGRRHIQNLQGLGERDIVSYDILDAHAYAGAAYGTHFVSSLEELWACKPDAALICTPPESHAHLALEAASRGCAVFIEKPLCVSESALIQLETFRGWGVNMVGCQWRWHPGPLAIKRWIEDGALGEVLSARFTGGYYLPDTKPNYKDSYAVTTGATLDVAWHMADLALWMLGGAKLRSASVRSAKSIGLEGTDGLAALTLDHDNGAISVVEGSFIRRDYRVGIELIGTKRSAFWQPPMAWMADERETGFCCTEVSDAAADQMYVDELAHFLACVRDGRPTCNPVSEAAKVLGILLEARKADKHG